MTKAKDGRYVGERPKFRYDGKPGTPWVISPTRYGDLINVLSRGERAFLGRLERRAMGGWYAHRAKADGTTSDIGRWFVSQKDAAWWLWASQ